MSEEFVYTPACAPPDKYDREVMQLLAYKCPDDFSREVRRAWVAGGTNAEALFRFATPDGFPGMAPGGGAAGCLTMIRALPEHYCAWTPELTAAIAADSRIPCHFREITPADLPVFTEYQRRLDAEIRQPQTEAPAHV